MDSLETAAREAGLQLRIRMALEAAGAWVYTTHGEPMGRVGAPDFLVCYRGRFYGLEVKRQGGMPTAIQSATLRKITQAGGIALVVRSIADALAAIGVEHDSG